MRKIYFILLSCFFTQFLTSQTKDSIGINSPIVDSHLVDTEMKMMSLGKTVLLDSLLINRQNANRELTILLEKTLSDPNAYAYPFDSLLTISKLRSADDSFRLFTWQLFEKDDTYTYMGYILKSDGTLIKLNDASSDYISPEFETGDEDHWYGALYYNLIPFESEGQTMHLVFGFDGNSLMERRKIIDVLSFDEEGNPTFGASVFIPGDYSKAHPASLSRIILEYYAEAKISCNYNEIQNQVLFDHLIFMKTEFGQFLIPDGSYEGYVLEEGKWKHNAKVFHHTYDTAPFPEPKGESKDIFGDDHRATVNPNRSKKGNEEVRKRNAKRRAVKEKAKAESKNR